jgi:hypothetical protein
MTIDSNSTVFKVFVGYTTRRVPDEWLTSLTPVFSPRGGTTDPAKIAAQIAEKKAAWEAEAASMPYTGTFDKVCLLEPSRKLSVSFDSKDRFPFGEKPAVSAQVGQWLLKHFPGAWSDEPNFRGQHSVVFVGFNPKLFLKLLGLECSLPVSKVKLPLSLWYGNSDHRDIQEAVMPKDFATFEWKSITAARRRGLNEEDAAKYDTGFADWNGPHVNAEADRFVSTVFGAQLGFI